MELIAAGENKRKYMRLLLLADEQESMIEKYLDHGEMLLLRDCGRAVAECVVTDEGGGVLEIKNIAVYPELQKMGYGKKLIGLVEKKFSGEFNTLRVGTGDSPATLPFYKKCGFKEVRRIKNFFTDNYDHHIYECGVLLRDMVVLEKPIAKK